MIGKKLRMPINSFELRDIKKGLYKVSFIPFRLSLTVKYFLVH